ncbi:MAG: transposase [Planctomycetota bacterium]
MKSASRTAAGPAILPEAGSEAAVTQAMWRFLRNPRVRLPALVAPLRQVGRDACAKSPSEFVLLAHDWCKLDYARHRSKRDKRQLTHEYDIGYDLTTALLVDAQTGSPLAPMQVQLKTADAVYSTAEHPAVPDGHHLDQLQPTMDEVAGWKVPRRVVHVIDREADSLGHFRKWDAAGHLYLVRCDDRRVLWEEEPWLISQIAEHFNQEGCFQDVREVRFQGKAARQEVAEATIVLHRPHKTRKNGKQHDVSGRALSVRLVVARVVDAEGWILAQWTLLTNVPTKSAAASQIALWYYWRWRIESFFKLLKSHGQEVEYWQQESGEAIARRLLVAAMACVVVWKLQRQKTRKAERFKRLLVRLSGRRMKHGVRWTAPALLAGYMVLLSITDLLEHTDYDLQEITALATHALPFLDTS